MLCMKNVLVVLVMLLSPSAGYVPLQPPPPLTTATMTASPSTVLITIAAGKFVIGNFAISREDRPYHAFEGIPYARIQGDKVKPSDPWIAGVLDATEKKRLCPEPRNGTTVDTHGNEDCLFLNIYTAKVFKILGADLPVLVYIHGQSRQTLEPKLFMDMKIVLVTINYRLTPQRENRTSGDSDVGTQDQILALRWIHENIVDYGGDPNRVTVMDNSDAGTSVTQLMESPLAKGLFREAIAQTRSGYSNWSLQPSEYWTHTNSDKINCTDHDKGVAEANDLVQATKSLLRLQDLDFGKAHRYCSDSTKLLTCGSDQM